MPCLYICLSMCGVIPIGVTSGAVLFVPLSVCGVIAISVTPGAMSVHLFVNVWSHSDCCWCDTRCHVCLYVCLSVWNHSV